LALRQALIKCGAAKTAFWSIFIVYSLQSLHECVAYSMEKNMGVTLFLSGTILALYQQTGKTERGR
jgi:hypothetical protein